MSNFYARIELHGAPKNYDKLHEIMEQLGWDRIVNSDKGPRVLPGGMYVGTSSDRASVIELVVYNAVLAANISNPAPWVMVIDAKDASFHLDPAPAPTMKKSA